MKQTLTCRQVWWSILLGTYDYVIIPKLGKLNQADGLSRRPDYKEGIASKNAERVLLDPRKFLLKPEQFHIQALHNTAIPTGMDEELHAAIMEAIKIDNSTGMGEKLKKLITSRPRHVMDCPAYLILSFLFCLLVPLSSVTLGRFAHHLHTYLWTDLAFSRDFHMLPYASIPLNDLLSSSSSFGLYLYKYCTS